MQDTPEKEGMFSLLENPLKEVSVRTVCGDKRVGFCERFFDSRWGD